MIYKLIAVGLFALTIYLAVFVFPSASSQNGLNYLIVIPMVFIIKTVWSYKPNSPTPPAPTEPRL